MVSTIRGILFLNRAFLVSGGRCLGEGNYIRALLFPNSILELDYENLASFPYKTQHSHTRTLRFGMYD